MFRRSKKKPQIPVTILTGFLGSGKTTLLNRILKSNDHGMKFAVIENELGDVGIDDKIIHHRENIDGEEIVEVMNGCICCTVRGDLVKTLNKLYKKVESFDGLIIETTGLADPAPVVQTFFIDHHLCKMYKIDAVITVVDAIHIRERLSMEPKGDGVINESAAQIAFADKILLNKTDLVENDKAVLDQIENEIKAINSSAPILRCSHSDVHPSELVNVDAFSLDRVLEFDPDFLQDLHETKHEASIGTISFKFEGELNNMLLQNWIQRLLQGEAEDGDDEEDDEGPTIEEIKSDDEDENMEIEDEDEDMGTDHNHDHDHGGHDDFTHDPDAMQLFRYKGLFAVKGFDEKFVFQGVGMFFNGEFSDKMVWKPGETRESRMVFIGRNLNMDLLRKGFEACKVKHPLRFKVGDKIEACTGRGFKEGTILKQWDEGNAYRIRLKNRLNGEIWAPIDINEYVRAP